ncbi:MAG: hypothetical protein K9L69_01380 [Candidatus Omnitrophica bacterium]|nr:hypothetical protein [Candidatus Omnitrophota bacterium]MCF7894773.1 hypothetical protein [Candidatus Omnitrophota bacterium]
MKFLIILAMVLFFVTGCAKVKEGAKEVGKPVGKTMDTMGGLSEGAVEGYSDTGREQPNPYDR